MYKYCVQSMNDIFSTWAAVVQGRSFHSNLGVNFTPIVNASTVENSIVCTITSAASSPCKFDFTI